MSSSPAKRRVAQTSKTTSSAKKPSLNVKRPKTLGRSKGAIQLEIVNRSGRSVPSSFLKKWVDLMSREASLAINPARFAGHELVIAFVTTSEIRALNKAYRGKDKPTDVLSFGPDESASGEADWAGATDGGGGDPFAMIASAPSLGELAISPEVIARQAQEHGLLVREELGYMVLHGFLHLLGYDHETNDRDAKRMFKLQDELFERLLAKI